MNALEIKELSFSYDGVTNVVDNITFSLEKGKFVSIIGHNGSGKSTLAKLIIGLLTKKSGSIRVFECELDEKSVKDIRKKIGIVFQNPDNQFIATTVEDDIAFGLENNQISQQKMVELVNEFALKVGMEKFMNKEPANLSGGQKQRVAIAGVLAMMPNIVIFDEATSMLDPKGKADIRELIKNMRKNNPEMTVLSITHDIEEAFLTDEVIVMNEGKLIRQGTPLEVFADREVLKEISLSEPFFLELRNKLLVEGYQVDKCESLEDLMEYLCQ
ncbi:MAG: energy-coupling factor transporter ATPase [Bacilli bacterium]|jgi:energy-coupling factor transport system ATP-binding protein|nr:energy-coupling factor transporter ATPase [Bacilli bacterium]